MRDDDGYCFNCDKPLTWGTEHEGIIAQTEVYTDYADFCSKSCYELWQESR